MSDWPQPPQSPAYPLPTGWLAETFPRGGATPAGTIALTSQVLRLSAIQLAAGMTVTTVNWLIGTTALVLGTSPHSWGALYGWDGTNINFLRQSTDDTAASMPASTVKPFTLTSPYVVPATGVYYIGIMVAQTGGTLPTLFGVGTATTGPPTLAPAVSGDSTGGLTTTAPSPTASVPLTAKNPGYGGVS